jgi:hypothetical protein
MGLPSGSAGAAKAQQIGLIDEDFGRSSLRGRTDWCCGVGRAAKTTRVCRDKDGRGSAQFCVDQICSGLWEKNRCCKLAGRAIAHVHPTVPFTRFGAEVGKGQTHFRQRDGLIDLGSGENGSMRKATEQEAYRHQQDHCGLCKGKLNAPAHAF